MAMLPLRLRPQVNNPRHNTNVTAVSTPQTRNLSPGNVAISWSAPGSLLVDPFPPSRVTWHKTTDSLLTISFFPLSIFKNSSFSAAFRSSSLFAGRDAAWFRNWWRSQLELWNFRGCILVTEQPCSPMVAAAAPPHGSLRAGPGRGTIRVSLVKWDSWRCSFCSLSTQERMSSVTLSCCMRTVVYTLSTQLVSPTPVLWPCSFLRLPQRTPGGLADKSILSKVTRSHTVQTLLPLWNGNTLWNKKLLTIKRTNLGTGTVSRLLTALGSHDPQKQVCSLHALFLGT